MNTVTVQPVLLFIRGLTLEFSQVDQSVVSDNPERNADLDLLLCKLIFQKLSFC